MRHFLYNNASIKLLDRENHVPVFAPDYVAVFDGELFEVLWLDVAVVLRMWMCKDECYFTFLVICVQRTLFLSTKKFIHFSTMFL